MEKQTAGVPVCQTEARARGGAWAAVGHWLHWVGAEELPRPRCSSGEELQRCGADTAMRFLPPLEVRLSSFAPEPAESRGAPPPPQDPSPLRGTLGSSLRSPAEGEGHEGFPPPPDKDLESPQVPHTDRQVACHPVNNSTGKWSSMPPHKTRPDFLYTLATSCEELTHWKRL